MGFNRQIVSASDRSISLATANVSNYDFPSSGNSQDSLKHVERVMISVSSDRAVSFQLFWGRSTEEFSALPYSTSSVSVTANDSATLEFIPGGGCEKCRLVITNASGNTAAIKRDITFYG